MNPVNSSLNKRYIELDSLRGLAALAVFFSHALSMINLKDRPYASLIEKSVLHIFWDGSAAVVLFFVLSGFVLALPYVGEKEKPVDFIPFIIRRIFRIYPAYYAALAISILLKFYIFRMGGLNGLSAFMTQFWDWPNEHLTWSSVVKHMIMIGPKYSMGQIDPIIWSLVVEMKVSLVFPFIIPVIRRIKTLWVAAAFFVVFVVLYEITKSDILSYIPLFILGGLIARFRQTLVDWFRKLPVWVCLVIGAVSIVLYTFRYSVPELPHINYTRQNFVIGFGVALIILLVISRQQLSSILSLAPLKYLGDISYSFYLLHFPILMTVTSLIYPGSKSVKAPWVISLILSLSLPYLTYRWVERPFQEVGRTAAKMAKGLLDKRFARLPSVTGNNNQMSG